MLYDKGAIKISAGPFRRKIGGTRGRARRGASLEPSAGGPGMARWLKAWAPEQDCLGDNVLSCRTRVPVATHLTGLFSVPEVVTPLSAVHSKPEKDLLLVSAHSGDTSCHRHIMSGSRKMVASVTIRFPSFLHF